MGSVVGSGVTGVGSVGVVSVGVASMVGTSGAGTVVVSATAEGSTGSTTDVASATGVGSGAGAASAGAAPEAVNKKGFAFQSHWNVTFNAGSIRLHDGGENVRRSARAKHPRRGAEEEEQGKADRLLDGRRDNRYLDNGSFRRFLPERKLGELHIDHQAENDENIPTGNDYDACSHDDSGTDDHHPACAGRAEVRSIGQGRDGGSALE